MLHLKTWILALIALLPVIKLSGQTCSLAGQLPANAIPICGNAVLDQQTVALCTQKAIPAGRCGFYNLPNNKWYRFTCMQSGTLGFQLIPKYLVTSANLGDDYNWQLFDITDHSPDDIYIDPSLFVAANWSGTFGVTGTNSSEPDSNKCLSTNSDRITPFSRMPMLIQGHQYLLLVVHVTNTASGYQLLFGGGTAILENTAISAFQNLSQQCDGKTMAIKFNKLIQCGSLASDGSDFVLSSTLATITSAKAIGCSLDASTDSVVLYLSNALPAGQYNISAAMGTDGNTFLDICGNDVGLADKLNFTAAAQSPVAAIGGLQMIGCNPIILLLTFDKPVKCNSIAQDGSDFTITGPGILHIHSVLPNCVDTLASNVTITLEESQAAGGDYQVRLNKGSDGNSIIDACGQETPAETSLTVRLGNCSIMVPSGFTPNGDGHNDYLYPLNGSFADHLVFRVYNRYGQLLFESGNNETRWNGMYNGKQQPSGLYVWTMQYIDRNSGQRQNLKGTTLLIR